jgi:hypothetical protein
MKYFLYTLLFLSVLIVPDIIQKKRREKRLKKYIEQVWGSEEDRLDEPVKDFDHISAFYKNMARQEDGFFIDDITWNDLLMDDVYNRINHTMSVCGEQYLYYMMRRTEEDEALLRKRIETLELFQKNPDQLKDIQYHLMEYGKNRSFDFSKYFFEHSGDIAEKNIRYVLQAVLLLLSPLLFLIDRSLGIVTAIFTCSGVYSKTGSPHFMTSYNTTPLLCATEMAVFKLVLKNSSSTATASGLYMESKFPTSVPKICSLLGSGIPASVRITP